MTEVQYEAEKPSQDNPNRQKEHANKIVNITSSLLIGVGLVSLTNVFLDISESLPGYESSYIGVVSIIGGLSMYAVNKRQESGSDEPEN